MEEITYRSNPKRFNMGSGVRHARNVLTSLFSWTEAGMVLLGIIFLLSCSEGPSSSNQIEAEKVTVPPIIDGDLDDASWEKAKPITLKENRTGNMVTDVQLMTKIKACYDDDNLYLAFNCKDPDIWTSYTQRDEHLWKEEAVEVFIDVDDVPENYIEIEVSPANVLFDSYIVDPQNIDVAATALLNLKEIKTAVRVDGTLNKRDDKDTGWTVELAIPFNELTTPRTKQITSDTEIRINFYRLDMSKGMDRGAYAWSPTGASFHKPSVFGRLILK